MGKPRQRKAAGSATKPPITQQIEQAERAKLAKSAQKKLAAGESLTAHEKAEINRRQQETFLSVFLSCGRSLFADLLEASSKVLCDNRDRRGFPWPEGKRDPVDGRKILRFLWRYYLENKPSESSNRKRSTDEILLEGASPELKDEYVREQIREKQINRELKELDLAKAREAHLPTEAFRARLMEAGQLIAKKREYLERVLPDPQRTVVSQAFDDMADALEKRAQQVNDGSDLETIEQLLAE